MKVQVGDRVYSDTGGPLMSVISLEGKDKVQCKWFDGENFHTRTFHVSTIKTENEYKKEVSERQESLNKNSKTDFDPYD